MIKISEHLNTFIYGCKGTKWLPKRRIIGYLNAFHSFLMVGYLETIPYHFSPKCPFEADDQKQKFQSFPSVIEEVAIVLRKREYKTMMIA